MDESQSPKSTSGTIGEKVVQTKKRALRARTRAAWERADPWTVYLEAVRRGATERDACSIAGLVHATLCRIVAADPEKQAQEHAARGEWYERMRNHVEAAASDDWKAAAWLLERRDRINYGDRKAVEVSGPDGAPLQVLTARVLTPAERRAELAAIAAEAQAALAALPEDGEPPGGARLT